MKRLTLRFSEPGRRTLVAIVRPSSKQALEVPSLPFLFANRSVRFIFAEKAREAKLSLWSS